MMTFYRALLLVTIAPLWGQSIKRLSPSAFPELPSAVRRALNLRGCSVPQSFLTGPHNVIKGEFARPGQTDWAVLCSVNGVSGILVFWNGSPDRPAAIAPQPDANSVQGITDTVTAYSREITAVGKKFIMRHYLGYGGPKPPPMNHQGIDDAFLEKASVTYYYYRGKWLQLTGAD